VGERQSRILGKRIEADVEKCRSLHILDGAEGALESLKRILRGLGVLEFIIYMPTVSDLELMKLLYNNLVKPLKEYTKKLGS